MPWRLSHVWEWFKEILDPAGNGWGPSKISFTEIHHYAEMTNQLILPQEARLIRRLSETFNAAVQENRPDGNNKPIQNLTSMNDNEGLKALFRNVGAKQVRKPTP